MAWLLEVVLLNAATATLLAFAAATADLLCRNRAVVYALWLTVILKLIAPSLVELPLPWFNPPAILPTASTQTGASLPLGDAPSVDSKAEESQRSVSNPPRLVEPASSKPFVSATGAAGCVWLLGAALWWSYVIINVRRFSRILTQSDPASAAVDQEYLQVARRFGISRPPDLRVAPGAFSPLLWTLGGKPIVLTPSDLLERLDELQRSALFAHELAHWRRRDHWVRLLQVFVLGVHWWNPVAWWACRRLQQTEEECCDAMVVRAMERRRPYAEALYQTIEFLSEATLSPPPVSVGLGNVSSLQRRFSMISKGTLPASLSLPGKLALAAGALLILPLQPVGSNAQQGRRTVAPRSANESRSPSELEEPTGRERSKRLTLTRRADNGAYGTAAYSFRRHSQDFQIHRNKVDLVYNGCGLLHVNPHAGLNNLVADVGAEPLGRIKRMPRSGWIDSAFEPKQGHVFVQWIRDRNNSFVVKYKILEDRRDRVVIEWDYLNEENSREPEQPRPGEASAGTLGQCAGHAPGAFERARREDPRDDGVRERSSGRSRIARPGRVGRRAAGGRGGAAGAGGQGGAAGAGGQGGAAGAGGQGGAAGAGGQGGAAGAGGQGGAAGARRNGVR